MSVVAWDGRTLAADKRAGQEMPRTVTKIRRAVNGNLMGAVGTACGDQELMAWYDQGADPAKFPARHLDLDKGSHLIVIERSGIIRQYAECPWACTFEDRFHAIGSGRDFAMAAMHLGRTASQAVELACTLSATCGNGIDTLTLEDAS